jgi:hypothetical protein
LHEPGALSESVLHAVAFLALFFGKLLSAFSYHVSKGVFSLA